MLDQNIQFLKGVGPKRAAIFSKIGIFTLRDLLTYFPREYEDRRKPVPIASIKGKERISVKGKVLLSEEKKLSMRLSAFKVKITDGTGTLNGVFFRKVNPYQKFDIFATLKKYFVPGAEVYLSGMCEYNFGYRELSVDEYEVVSKDKPLIHFGRIVPLYPLTEGIGQKWMREFFAKNINIYSDEWPEILPEGSKYKRGISAAEALREIHFPEDLNTAELARRRLAFDEFFLIETALNIARARDKKIIKNRRYELKRNLLTPFREKLNFEFTQAQKKVINEIFDDLKKEEPMKRLLMGDVGSGKTVVALSAMLFAIENGCQSVIIAPTEILAEQHYLTISNILEGLPVNAVLLSGKITAKKSAKEKTLSDIASGAANIIIGTHAILEKNVAFKNLALIVIDEQHRFGVIQRALLQEKSEHPDVLVMTATPIPRTLALTVYGDMDVSIIDKLPPGRQPIETLYLGPEGAYDVVKKEIKKGNKAYIVYPLVEESDKVELKAAVKEAENLSKAVFKDFKVGLLHGQMKTDEREKTMLDFRSGRFDVLIATTVIEVGIDIKDATVMVIEHAERFGLATLHQLRGRIGRSSKKSFCVLVGDPKSEQSRERIKAMLETQDGFRIAEKDLELRGPGEFFGTAQSGILEFKAGNIVTDSKLIEESKDLAKEVTAKDPGLNLSQHKMLKKEVARAYGKTFGLFKIG